MNYLLQLTSPDYPLKFSKNNPPVDNDIDLGKFVRPAALTAPLLYIDADNDNISYDRLIKNDVLSSVSGGILISRKLSELIETHFPQQVQLIPCSIEYRNQINEDYFVLNVYTKVPCYDLEQSIYEVSPVDNSYEFEKIVLIEGMLEEYEVVYDIVRSAHDNKIVVSQQFKDIMEAENINALEYLSSLVIEW